MQGTILGYDAATATGVISGADGRRYSFAAGEWRGGGEAGPVGGLAVDFESIDGTSAVGVYPLPAVAANQPYTGSARLAPEGSAPPPYPGQPYPGMAYPKSHVVAGLLALFLGGWGIHKFYLGYNNEGVILLVSSFVSFVLCFVIIGFIPLLAISIICFVEAIIYLTKSDAEFDELYVRHKKAWF